LQFGFGKTLERLKKLFPSASKIEMRKGSGKMGFVITDNNNYLVDVYFDKALSQDYDFKNLEKEIRLISGVIESGLFADPADVVFIASLSKVEIIS
jgi:ribose 5-phosphate isomerase A